MNMRGWVGPTVTMALGLAVASPAGAQELELGVSTGVHYTSGDFGGDAVIEETYIPIGVSATYGRMVFGIRAPYLSVNTTDATGTISESGMGDVTTSLTVLDVLYSPEQGLALDISGTVKFGTADSDKQLGTGENDVTIYFDGYKFFDDVTVLGTVGYRWRGEPVNTSLNNVIVGSLGAVFFTENNAMLGVTVNYRQSAIADADDVRELQAFAALPINDRWEVEIYGFTGFTDSSPDWGGGVSVAANLNRFALREPR